MQQQGMPGKLSLALFVYKLIKKLIYFLSKISCKEWIELFSVVFEKEFTKTFFDILALTLNNLFSGMGGMMPQQMGMPGMGMPGAMAGGMPGAMGAGMAGGMGMPGAMGMGGMMGMQGMMPNASMAAGEQLRT